MTPELTVDARWLRTGIGRYTEALLSGLREHLPGLRLSCVAQAKDVALVSPFVDHVVTCDAGIYGAREQLALPWLARKATALYVPHYNIPILWRGRLLVTIHDLNHLLADGYRNTWRSRLYARPLLRMAAQRADVIVTPSHYTKSRILDELRADPSRIQVIPCCVASCFRKRDKVEARRRVAKNLAISQPFLLFVGNCAPNKNLACLLRAVATLRERRADTPLLVVAGGRGKWERSLAALAGDLKLQNSIVWLDKPADRMLADLYSAALMTVMPSFEEGFGLPVIESMACGTPVVCARAASLPEVAGNAAVFFSPFSSEELAAAIEQIVDSSALEHQLIVSGLARAAMFSQKSFRGKQASAIRALLPSQQAACAVARAV